MIWPGNNEWSKTSFNLSGISKRNMRSNGEILIEELLSGPAEFREKGKAYALLQEYFHGLPLHTLKPLISHGNIEARRVAVWIASELGKQGCFLLADVIPLLGEGDRYISYHVLDILIVCSGKCGELKHIALALVDMDEVIRRRAMILMVRADRTQLAGALAQMRNDEIIHRRGLELLLSYDAVQVEQVVMMLKEPADLLRRYGAILAKKREKEELLCKEGLQSSEDPDIQYLSNY